MNQMYSPTKQVKILSQFTLPCYLIFLLQIHQFSILSQIPPLPLQTKNNFPYRQINAFLKVSKHNSPFSNSKFNIFLIFSLYSPFALATIETWESIELLLFGIHSEKNWCSTKFKQDKGKVLVVYCGIMQYKFYADLGQRYKKYNSYSKHDKS